MLRGLGSGLMAMIGVGVVHGVAWWLGITFGLIVVGIAGGWLIGRALRARAAGPEAEPRRLQLVGALLGAGAYVVGSLVAFVIVQLSQGQGDLIGRLAPANLAAFMGSLFDLPLVQAATLAAYVVVAWATARSDRSRRPAQPRET